MQNLPSFIGFAGGWLRSRNFLQIPPLKDARAHIVAEDAKSSEFHWLRWRLGSRSEFFANSAPQRRESAHRSGRCKIFRVSLASLAVSFAVGIFCKFRYSKTRESAHRSGRCKIFRVSLASLAVSFAVGIFCKFRYSKTRERTS